MARRLSKGTVADPRSIEQAINRLGRVQTEKQTRNEPVQLPVYSVATLPRNLPPATPYTAFLSDTVEGNSLIVWYNGGWYKVTTSGTPL